ncbi:MAG: CPBP family intramembrane metalloprotease [Fidelibacterota bacterium]|nr:MAG: CPBP family intramembrane metalloprotease [Candidatus Neomarinimicrobiota bacterium]
MKPVVQLGTLAAIFWLFLFSPWTSGWMNFWGQMVSFTGILAGSALLIDWRRLDPIYGFQPNHALIGVVSAVVLYLIFFLGDLGSSAILAFAGSQVENIYASKAQASPLLIGGLLLVWIGPAEEIFWRGFIQRRLGERFGVWKGYLLGCLIYGGVHLWALNFMLFMAALVAGLFWGAMFIKYGSVWPGIISHALWDVAIFVIWPID